MSRKIIGITVGSSLPKPNFNQTDPTKGDYIRNKPDFDGLKERVDAIGGLIGDTSVAEQIANAVSEIKLPDHTWESLPDKPFGEEGTGTITYEWDGAWSSLNLDIGAYKASDTTPDPETLIGAVLVVKSGDYVKEETVLTSANINSSEADGVCIILDSEGGERAVVAYEGNALNMEKGIYLGAYYRPEENMILSYAASLTLNGSSTIKTLDSKFIGSDIARVEYVDEAIASIATSDVSGKIGEHNTSETAHEDIRSAINNVSTLVGDTSVSEQIAAAIGTGVEQVQADWDQTDETQPDFIKNKPDEMDALLLLSELDLTQPAFVDADNSVYLDESNNILIL